MRTRAKRGGSFKGPSSSLSIMSVFNCYSNEHGLLMCKYFMKTIRALRTMALMLKVNSIPSLQTELRFSFSTL